MSFQNTLNTADFLGLAWEQLRRVGKEEVQGQRGVLGYLKYSHPLAMDSFALVLTAW